LLSLEDKKAIVADVASYAEVAQSAVAAEYSGLTVEQMTQLRASARQAGVYLRVVKNTLAKRAVAGTEFECIQDSLTGPLVLAFSRDEPAAAARVISDFSKRCRRAGQDADEGRGDQSVDGCHEGPGPEIRQHTGRAGQQTGPDAGSGSRTEKRSLSPNFRKRVITLLIHI